MIDTKKRYSLRSYYKSEKSTIKKSKKQSPYKTMVKNVIQKINVESVNATHLHIYGYNSTAINNNIKSECNNTIRQNPSHQFIYKCNEKYHIKYSNKNSKIISSYKHAETMPYNLRSRRTNKIHAKIKKSDDDWLNEFKMKPCYVKLERLSEEKLLSPVILSHPIIHQNLKIAKKNKKNTKENNQRKVANFKCSNDMKKKPKIIKKSYDEWLNEFEMKPCYVKLERLSEEKLLYPVILSHQISDQNLKIAENNKKTSIENNKRKEANYICSNDMKKKVKIINYEITSYEMTPIVSKKPSEATEEDYNIKNLSFNDSTDHEESPKKKKVPTATLR